MQSSFEAARAGLRSITEAAELLEQTNASDGLALEIVYKGVYDAASLHSLERHFASTSESKNPPKEDWLETITAADLEIRSAHVLLGVAAVRGELPVENAASAQAFLSGAIADAQDELIRMQPMRGRAAFVSAKPTEQPSETLDVALAKFRTAADATISEILNQSEQVISAAFDKIKSHASEMKDALVEIMGAPATPGGFSGFLAKAWEKLQAAIGLFRRLLSSISIDELGTKIEELRDTVTVKHGLELVYKVQLWRSNTNELHLAPDMKIQDVDNDRVEVVDLGIRFAELASRLRTTLIAASIVASLIAAHLTGPLAPLLLPGLNVAVASIIIVFGMTYFGELRIGHALQNIRAIEEDLAGKLIV